MVQVHCERFPSCFEIGENNHTPKCKAEGCPGNRTWRDVIPDAFEPVESTHGKPDGAVQEALVRLENACEAQRQSYRDHPEYSEGFYDAQCGDPLFDDATDPYRAGWEAFYVCKEIMDHNGFSRTADGSFEKSFTIGRALQQSQSQSQEGT